MKKLLFFSLLLVGCVTTGLAALTALRINTYSHGTITLLLENEPALTFNDDRSITIEPGIDEGQPPVTISFDDVESCQYADTDDNTGVAPSVTTPEQTIVMSFVAGGIHFANIPDGTGVEVFTTAGAQVMRAPVSEGEYTLPYSRLTKGIYIVRIGRFATKISI